MRRSSVALLSAGVFIASVGVSVAAAPVAGSTQYTMDQPIDVVLTQRVSSESAHVGDAFYFKTASEVHLGDVDLSAGTPGTGRLATVVPATRNSVGQLALQADSLSSASGATVWVNIDTTVTPRGHFSSKRDIVLDPGMTFRVKTIAPRHANAPLIDTTTPTPTATPMTSAMPITTPAAMGSAGASSAPSSMPSAASPLPSVSPSVTP